MKNHLNALRPEAGLVLAGSFPLVCVLGFFANYLLLLLAIALLARYLLIERSAMRPDAIGWMFLAVFMALSLTYVVTAQSTSDLLMVFNLLPFALYPVFAGTFGRSRSRDAPIVIGRFAAIGVAIGLGLAVVDSFVLGAPRAGYITSDPIRISNTALVLSFFAFAMAPAESGWRRIVLMSAPVMALVIIVLAGARTALVAFGPVALLSIFLLLPARRALTIVGIGVLAAIAGLAIANSLDLIPERISSLPNLLSAMVHGDDIADRSLAERLELYRTGLLAFTQSPFVGYGWANFASAIAPFIKPDFQNIVGLPHLHNELITFAVTSGLVGVASYVCLLSLPIVGALISPRGALRTARLRLALILSASYFFLGLADTMLIFELHMTLFVVWTASILSYVRVPAEATVD